MDERTVLFIVLWALGLISGFWMVRRGHDPRWIYLGALLGPIFVPIAIERVRSHPIVIGDVPTPVHNRGLRVLVGYDGSPQSREAVAAARRLFASCTGELVLAQVVSYDAAEEQNHADVEAARRRLSEMTSSLGVAEATFEVLAGPPAKALCTLAREQDMDLLVVGRRGRGLSQRVLGSVAENVVKNARLPVLVAHSA
ncbi:universal stress protein [Nocardioides pacificus]